MEEGATEAATVKGGLAVCCVRVTTEDVTLQAVGVASSTVSNLSLHSADLTVCGRSVSVSIVCWRGGIISSGIWGVKVDWCC